MMLFVLTLAQKGACLAAGWLCCLAWQQYRRTRDTPVYIWPIDAMSRWEQQRECLVRAGEAYRLKRHTTAGLQAQWRSGLGREFPINHCN